MNYLPMNPRTRSLLIVGIAIAVPVSGALANGPRRSSFARSSGGRSVAQARPAFQSRAAFNRSGAAFQRSGSFSRANNWNGASFNANRTAFSANRAAFNGNRVAINRNATGLNRFNGGFNRAVTNQTGSNRFAATGINRGGNWNRFGSNRWNGNGNWGHHHGHHHHDDNFIFFGGFGFPFYSAWDYGYYPGAYYPYYPYSTYNYDPYGYSYGAPAYGYSYGGSGYDSGYSDPGYGGDPNYDGRHRYSRDGSAHNDQTVARVQDRLAQDGYYKGEIDGIKGSRTHYAIRAYQHDHNLPVDGEISDELLQAMGLH